MKNSTLNSILNASICSVWIIISTNMAMSQINIGHPKSGWLTGTVKERLYDDPIPNVDIEVSRRIIDFDSYGQIQVHPYYDVENLNINARTDEKGQFKIPVSLKGNDWFLIKYHKLGYDDMFGLMVSPNKFETDPSENIVYFFKSIYSEIEYAQIYENNLKLNEIEKQEYYNGEVDSTANEIDETRNRNINCSYSPIPTTVNVKHLIEGYNSYTCNDPGGETGPKNFIDFIACVVQKEYYAAFGTSSKPEGLKAQAVVARSFALSRINAGYWANCGHAWTANASAASLTAAQNTSQFVLTYNGSIKETNYGSQCNGDVTQNSEEGRWTNCSPSCSVCGNSQAWQKSRACSGHAQPVQCQSWIPSANAYRKLFGPGVGLCQKGTQDFAAGGFKFDNILSEFYTNMCVANFNYLVPSNDDSCFPTTLLVGTSCIKNLAHNFSASTSTGIPNPTCGFSSSSSKDVWFRFTVPSSGQYRIETYKGSITDAAMATYIGGCSSLSQVACNDTYNGNTMPTITGTSTPGLWIYVRVWGKSGAIGTFSICVKNTINALQDDLPVESRADISKDDKVTVFPNPIIPDQTLYISGVEEGSDITILNPMQIKLNSKKSSGEHLIEFDISNLNCGIYFIQIRKKGVPTIYKEMLIQ